MKKLFIPLLFVSNLAVAQSVTTITSDDVNVFAGPEKNINAQNNNHNSVNSNPVTTIRSDDNLLFDNRPVYNNVEFAVAVQKNNLAKVKSLVENGYPVNTVVHEGNTMLHSAALYGWSEMIDYALSQDADRSLQNLSGELPLHLVARHSNINMFTKLVKADKTLKDVVNTLTKNKKNVLHYALAAKKVDLGFVQHLVGLGVNVNQPDMQGNTPVHYAAVFKHYEAMKYLINAGGDITLTNIYGSNPIQVSTVLANISEIELMRATYPEYFPLQPMQQILPQNLVVTPHKVVSPGTKTETPVKIDKNTNDKNINKTATDKSASDRIQIDKLTNYTNTAKPVSTQKKVESAKPQ